jgi:dolichyl-phosphate beta-glucosyltransferase
VTALLVVPCYRESVRIRAFLPELCAEMMKLGNVKVRLVDDGSGSDDANALETYVEELRPRFACLQPLLRLPENQGKGGAVYSGWDAGHDEEWLAFVDADGSCSAVETRRLLELTQSVRPEVTAIFASRIKMLGRAVHRQLKRHLIGRIYATLVSELLHIDVYDSQCGLKVVKRQAYEAARERLFIKRFAFDVDLLVRLLDAGGQVNEVPINWHEVPGGKVRLLRDSWRMFLDVLNIRKSRS